MAMSPWPPHTSIITSLGLSLGLSTSAVLEKKCQLSFSSALTVWAQLSSKLQRTTAQGKAGLHLCCWGAAFGRWSCAPRTACGPGREALTSLALVGAQLAPSLCSSLACGST
jgi:hypothetical protein